MAPYHSKAPPRQEALEPGARRARPTPAWLRVLLLLPLFYAFLLGVNGLGEGFKLLGRDVLSDFFKTTESPLVGLIIGILATSVVQSSSVTTSLIVGLVAAPDNPLPLENAVPMVMGANFGTTVTNTVVSLGHIRNKLEFSRAFAVSTCDDFFNLYAVAFLLPLELLTGVLRRSAELLAGLVTHVGGVDYQSPVGVVLAWGLHPIRSGIQALMPTDSVAGALLAVLSFGIIFGSLLLLIRALRRLVEAKVRAIIARSLERNPLLSMLGGLVVTAMVQSSSITTSLLVPLAGAGVINLRQAFPMVLGANLGTTLTALMASLATTGEHADAGIAIAIVHGLFNLFGILLFFPLGALRRLPLSSAEWLARVAERSAPSAILYVLLLFYGIPIALAAGTGAFN